MVSTITDLFNEYDEPAFPVVYFRGELVALMAGENGRHSFGGTLPEPAQVSSKFHRLVLTLDLPSLNLDPTQVFKIPNELFLVFDFNLYTVSIQYLASAHLVWLNDDSENSLGELPYPGYPDVFCRRAIHEAGRFSLGFAQFQELFTSQGLQEEESKLFVIVPPYKGFGVSLWGEEGDNEGVIVVFVIDPISGFVEGYTQCT